MYEIINEIKKRGKMNGNEVSDYSINVLGRKRKSAGACLARAKQYGYIKIVDIIYINGKEVNVYA